MIIVHLIIYISHFFEQSNGLDACESGSFADAYTKRLLFELVPFSVDMNFFNPLDSAHGVKISTIVFFLCTANLSNHACYLTGSRDTKTRLITLTSTRYNQKEPVM